MKICVYGLWHLGCVTAACMADLGFDVCGLDDDAGVIKKLASGAAPIFEPGLDERIRKGLASGRLSFSADMEKAFSGADVLWVAFDTPVDDEDRADIGYVERKTLQSLEYLRGGGKVVISSQAPVGFVRALEQACAKKYPGKELLFAVSPENLRLGNALAIFSNPDRMVIGVRSEAHIAAFEPLFSKITTRLEWMRTESAEMTKHAINSFLAMSVVFANEVAGICESVGADAAEVARGLKTEERIGPKAYVGPGTAFAGGTLARDIKFLIGTGDRLSKNDTLLKAVWESNNIHKDWIKRKLSEVVGGLKGRKVAVLGLTYKPGTSTLRRSLSVELCKWLAASGAMVAAYDSQAEQLPTQLAASVRVAHSVSEAVSDADCVIVGTEHPEFRQLDTAALEAVCGRPVIDPSGFLRKIIEKRPGAEYFCVGRGERL
ncbi:MAG: nucleotide sugar dehydrogenase [bacterium]